MFKSILQVVLGLIRTFHFIFNIYCHPAIASLELTFGLTLCAVKPEEGISLNSVRPMFCSIFVFSCNFTAYLT